MNSGRTKSRRPRAPLERRGATRVFGNVHDVSRNHKETTWLGAAQYYSNSYTAQPAVRGRSVAGWLDWQARASGSPTARCACERCRAARQRSRRPSLGAARRGGLGPPLTTPLPGRNHKLLET
eukprot:917557-Prymnesium_polylepis.1